MNTFNFATERSRLVDNLNYLRSLSVKEFTLRKKWDEMKTRIYPDRSMVVRASDGIWTPKNLMDEATTVDEISNLKPKVVLCRTDVQKEWWNIYRLFGSSADYNVPPTRRVRFLVVNEGNKRVCDEVPGLVLGVGEISGDVYSLRCRDEFIGWTNENKGTMLRNVAIGSTIVPTNPFGLNFLGGKLIAALTTSKQIRDEWKSNYGDVLAGLTTTALYGNRPSVYDSIKWWKSLGLSKGAVPIRPDAAIYSTWREYLKREHAEELDHATERNEGASGPTTNETGKVLSLICKVARIRSSDYLHGHQRCVYFSSIYENTKEFLCERLPETELRMKPLFEDDTASILNWWRRKAIERYLKLKSENRLDPNTLFYKDGYMMDWETFSSVWLGRM